MKSRIPSLLIASAIWFVLAPIKMSGQPQTQSTPTPTASTPAGSQGRPPQNAAPAKPVKVWSNDDIEGLRAAQGVSTVGPQVDVKKTGARSQPDANKADPSAKTLALYRQQLAPLRADVAKLDGE